MKVEGEPYYTIEKFLPGKFKKYLNNNGVAAKDGGVITDKMCSFAHWCYQKYSGRILLLDLQGVDYTLTDVAIATWELFDEGTHDILFGMDNISRQAIVTFSKDHSCSEYCAFLNLPGMEELNESMVEDHGSEVQFN
ncbi:alpha-protein kinase vwkA-like [Saccoglossus kowalevskii]